MSHKTKSHHAGTRTEEKIKKIRRAGATPSMRVAAHLNHARFETLPFPSRFDLSIICTAVSFWCAFWWKSYGFVISTRLEAARVAALSEPARCVSTSEVTWAEVAGFLAAGRGAHPPFHQHHIGKSQCLVIGFWQNFLIVFFRTLNVICISDADLWRLFCLFSF